MFFKKDAQSKVNLELSGMTLVEVMIAMGLVGALSLAVGTLVTSSTRSLMNTRASTEYNNLLSQIGVLVVNDTSCYGALVGSLPVLNMITGPTGALMPDGTNAPSAVSIDVSGIGTATEIKLYTSGAGTTTTLSSTAGNNRFGTLTIQRLALIQRGPAQNLPPPNSHSYRNIPMDLVITVNKPANTMGGTQLTNELTPVRLTVQVDASNHITNCTGLRAGDGTSFNIPTCGTGETLVGTGTNMFCRKTLCAPNEVSYGTDSSTQSVLCATMPTCSPIGFDITDSTGAKVKRYAAQIPMVPGGNLPPKCQIVSCPEGSTPQTVDGIITTCVKGLLPMECAPRNADCRTDGLIRYSNFACLAPSYAPSATSYFCYNDCSTATQPDGQCYLGSGFPQVGTNNLGKCTSIPGAQLVWSEDLNNPSPITAEPFPFPLDYTASFKSSKQIYCRLPLGDRCSNHGLMKHLAYYNKACCGGAGGWNWNRAWTNSGCHDSSFSCPGSCGGSTATVCSYEGLFGPGDPINMSVSCGGVCSVFGGAPAPWINYSCDCASLNCSCSVTATGGITMTSTFNEYCF